MSWQWPTYILVVIVAMPPMMQGIEHDDLSDASANGASGPTGAPPTVGSSARLSALGSLPLTSTNGGIPPAAAGDNRYNDSGVDNQAAGGAGVQLSLMGGKARYRCAAGLCSCSCA